MQMTLFSSAGWVGWDVAAEPAIPDRMPVLVDDDLLFEDAGVDERAEIKAAMDRLLDGIPLRSDGKLTVVSLAAEAGVKRHALTHKHTDLKDRFYARIKAQQSVPASEIALREQNANLRRKLDEMRAERDEYKQAADSLARTLNVLTIENDELRRKANRAAQLMGPRPRT